MGIGRTASAISGGALAIALGGGLPLLAATPAHALDCAGGLLSPATSTLCSVPTTLAGAVDGITDVVDQVAQGATSPVTTTVDNLVDGLADTASGTTNGLSQAVNGAGQAVIGSRPDGTANPPLVGSDGEQPGDDQDSDDQPGDGANAGGSAATRTPRQQGESAPTRGGAPSGWVTGTTSRSRGTLPIEPARPGFPQSHTDRTPSEPVNIDLDRLPALLWPGQKVPALVGGRHGGAMVRPGRPYDVTGTAVTAALLLSAVLATRVVAARNARAERRESIPFEGGLRLPSRSSQHRLA